MPNPPFDSVNDALNMARTRLNDDLSSLVPTSGKLLGNTVAFTQQSVNSAWRRLQEFLANLGYIDLVEEAVITGLGPVANMDPATQTYLDWTGYWNGATLNAALALPQDCIFPILMWERMTGQNACFAPMTNWLDGLPSQGKSQQLGVWEWRQRRIYMNGSLNTEDLRIRYAAYQLDFADVSATSRWWQQPIPMMRCLDALSWYICAEIVDAREDVEGSPCQAKAEAAAKLIMNRDIRAKQRVNVRRMPRSGRFQQSWGGYWC